MKDKFCKDPVCCKPAKKHIAITIKGINSGTIRVLRFCCRDHMLTFKEKIIEHNRRIDLDRSREREAAKIAESKLGE